MGGKASSLCAARKERILTNALTTKMLISTARGAFNTEAAIIVPCSVKAKGKEAENLSRSFPVLSVET